MNRRGFQDDAPPWSFFLPVTLAVVVGVLVADAVRLAIGAVFVREVAESTVPARTRANAPATEAAASAVIEPPEPAPSAPVTPAAAAPAADSEAPALPGPISAMRDGADRACINDTIAERRPNGWEQALEDDAPMRCSADSP